MFLSTRGFGGNALCIATGGFGGCRRRITEYAIKVVIDPAISSFELMTNQYLVMETESLIEVDGVTTYFFSPKRK